MHQERAIAIVCLRRERRALQVKLERGEPLGTLVQDQINAINIVLEQVLGDKVNWT